jgi:hypothetical protein
MGSETVDPRPLSARAFPFGPFEEWCRRPGDHSEDRRRETPGKQPSDDAQCSTRPSSGRALAGADIRPREGRQKLPLHVRLELAQGLPLAAMIRMSRDAGAMA